MERAIHECELFRFSNTIDLGFEKPTPEELEQLGELVESLSSDWDHEDSDEEEDGQVGSALSEI